MNLDAIALSLYLNPQNTTPLTQGVPVDDDVNYERDRRMCEARYEKRHTSLVQSFKEIGTIWKYNFGWANPTIIEESEKITPNNWDTRGLLPTSEKTIALCDELTAYVFFFFKAHRHNPIVVLKQDPMVLSYEVCPTLQFSLFPQKEEIPPHVRREIESILRRWAFHTTGIPSIAFREAKRWK